MIDSTRWMVAGYSVATVIYVGYVVTLWVRARRVRDRAADVVNRR